LVDNIVQLNAMATELGDRHLQEQRPRDALAVYRLVRSKDGVIKFQAERLTNLQKALEQNLAIMRAKPADAAQFIAENNRLRGDIEEAKTIYEQTKDLPDFMPALLVRIGRAYYDAEKRWEA